MSIPAVPIFRVISSNIWSGSPPVSKVTRIESSTMSARTSRSSAARGSISIRWARTPAEGP